MDFEIKSHALLSKWPNHISLPPHLREEIGVIVGQFLQLRGQSELVLEICGSLEIDQEAAYICPERLKQLGQKGVGFQILEVTLGCDPEFFITWGNRTISAATYLPAQGEIGSDGTLGELRPMYGQHEDRVVENLAQLIPQIPGRMRRLPWARGFPEDGRSFAYEAHSYSKGMAAGFHVHLGIPPEILNTRNNFNRAAINHLVRCLDWYVSVPLVPLEPAPERRLGVASRHYGQPGDYRPSNLTLEYRTPGAFYLRTPELARGLLGIALMLTKIVVSRMKAESRNFIDLPKLSAQQLQAIMPIPESHKIRAILLDKDTKVAKRELHSIFRALQELPNYPEHGGAVEGLFRAVEEYRQPGPNLLENWKE